MPSAVGVERGEQPGLEIDFVAAERFLTIMAEGEEVTFQTFDDSTPKRPGLAQVMHGTLEELAPRLAELNRHGAGIFWMVNLGDGGGRKAKNVTGVRAMFLDLDGAPLEPVLAAGVAPHAVIETSPGKWHAYWLVGGCRLDQFKAAQQALATKIGGDTSVCDLPRVLRVPGFLHCKGEPFVTRIVSLEPTQAYGFDDLVGRLSLDLTAAVKAPRVEVIDQVTGEIVGKVAAGGRHKHLLNWALQMNYRGMPLEAVRVALNAENVRICEPPKTESEVNALANDIMKRYASDHGRDLVLSNSPLTLRYEQMQASNEPRFKLLTADELRALPPLKWRVHGVLPSVGLAAIYGPSMSGKSFIAIDLASAIAEGAKWFGRRVKAAPVVYAALEGERGIKPRAGAWEAQNGRAVGFRTMLDPFRLDDPVQVTELADVVNRELGPGAVIIIDTLNRAAPTADENSSEGMGAILEGAKALQRLTQGLVILVHHTGKDVDRGMRGHSSLLAALDGSIEVSRSADGRVWRVAKSKDGGDGDTYAFGLAVVDLGVDEFGDPVTSCVIEPVGGTLTEHETGGMPRAKGLTPKQRLDLESLVSAAREHGVAAEDERVLGVHVETWRKNYYSTSTADTPDAKRKAYERARKALVEAGLVVVHDDHYMPTDPVLCMQIQAALCNPDTRTKQDIVRTCPGDYPDRTGHIPMGVSGVLAN